MMRLPQQSLTPQAVTAGFFTMILVTNHVKMQPSQINKVDNVFDLPREPCRRLEQKSTWKWTVQMSCQWVVVLALLHIKQINESFK